MTRNKSDRTFLRMEFKFMTIILSLCFCILLPLIIAVYFVLKKFLLQRRLANTKNVIPLAPTLSTAISIEIPNASKVGLSSSFSPHSTQVTDTPLTILPFSPRCTPFGTNRKTLDLAGSLKASLSKGPEALAAALDGVLALHHRLEEMRQQRIGTNPYQDRNALTYSNNELGQIMYM